MHTYIQVIYDIDTCLITVSFRCHVVYWSIVIIRHGFSGAPLSLQPFLDDVPLFHDISEEFPPIKGTFHPTKLSRLSIYIYIFLWNIHHFLPENRDIPIELMGIFPWVTGLSAGWIPIAECSPETRRRAAILILQVRKGGAKCWKVHEFLGH